MSKINIFKIKFKTEQKNSKNLKRDYFKKKTKIIYTTSQLLKIRIKIFKRQNECMGEILKTVAEFVGS